jgi:hypothetical protein
MRKGAFIFILGFSVVSRGVLAASGGGGDAASDGVTFMDIVTSGGIASLAVWLVVALAVPLALLLGVSSVVSSFASRGARTPLALKWLVLAAVFHVLASSALAMWSMAVALGVSSSTEAGMAVLAMSVSNALYISAFSAFLLLVYLFAIALSLMAAGLARRRAAARGSAKKEAS